MSERPKIKLHITYNNDDWKQQNDVSQREKGFCEICERECSGWEFAAKEWVIGVRMCFNCSQTARFPYHTEISWRDNRFLSDASALTKILSDEAKRGRTRYINSD